MYGNVSQFKIREDLWLWFRRHCTPPLPSSSEAFFCFQVLENAHTQFSAHKSWKNWNQPVHQASLGGFPGQQVIYGSQAIRTFGHICDAAGLSCAILFLDLASAFHHLIRECVVGAYEGSNLEPVLEVLQQSGHSPAHFRQYAKLLGILADIGLAEPIVRLLRDIHLSTWCTIHERWLLCTHRGTRPGSPLADIIFHALMARVAQEIDAWIQTQHDFVQLLNELHVEVPSILWADDIAIPLAARRADEIIPLLQKTLQQVRGILKSLGFTLNFSKGKTSAVLTLKGAQASELRKQYQLHSHPGVTCQFDDGTSEWLHFVSVYRHLGTLFASKHDLHCELKSRVGIAKAAFAQLAKPVLTNKHLPRRLRLQLFQSLVATKLYFGLGAWIAPNPKHLQYVQNALVGMLKRVLRLGQNHLSAERVFVLAQTADVRSRLAIERLLYAQRLFRTGPPFLHHLIHQEFDRCNNSWLHGLKADLEWMEQVNPNCLPSDWSTDMTALFDWWHDSPTTWIRAVKRTWNLHLAQNAIIADAKFLHAGVFQNLKLAGATFDSPLDELNEWEESRECFCGLSFTTKRGLLAHQRKAHGLFSAERQFLQGCTCLHCGKFLWSTQRLQQHLAYIPKALGYNPCFHALQAQDRQVTYSRDDPGASSAFAGLHRRECLQTEGPMVCPITTQEIRRARTQQELEECKEKLLIHHQPPDPAHEGELIGEELTQVTMKWFHDYYPQGPSDDEKAFLPDAWVEVLCKRCFASDLDLDPWLEMVFLLWGEHWLPDLSDSLEDGVAEIDIDQIFADFASQLERYRLLARKAHLEHRLRHCDPVEPCAHRPIKPAGTTKHPKVNSRVIQSVPRPFAEQSDWQQRIRKMQFLDLPAPQFCPKIRLPDGDEVFIVVHLFSGRRRLHDVHAFLAWVQCWTQPEAVGVVPWHSSVDRLWQPCVGSGILASFDPDLLSWSSGGDPAGVSVRDFQRSQIYHPWWLAQRSSLAQTVEVCAPTLRAWGPHTPWAPAMSFRREFLSTRCPSVEPPHAVRRFPGIRTSSQTTWPRTSKHLVKCHPWSPFAPPWRKIDPCEPIPLGCDSCQTHWIDALSNARLQKTSIQPCRPRCFQANRSRNWSRPFGQIQHGEAQGVPS